MFPSYLFLTVGSCEASGVYIIYIFIKKQGEMQKA